MAEAPTTSSSRAAKFFNLTVEPTPLFSVVVGSGQRLKCEGVIRAVPLLIQGCSLVMDLYLLSFYGADVVFGVAWLETLGPVLTNYKTRQFEFS